MSKNNYEFLPKFVVSSVKEHLTVLGLFKAEHVNERSLFRS